MKVIIADMMYPFGHKKLNKNLIDLISQFSKTEVIDKDDYYKDLLENNNILIKRIKFMKIPKKRFICYLFYCINLIILRMNINIEKDDKLIFMTHENISFSIMRFLFPKDRTIVFHHSSIDLLKTKKIQMTLFKKYMNNIKHIVFADFIRNNVINDTGLDKKNIFTIQHPLSGVKCNCNNKYDSKIAISLSLDSDENIIEDLIIMDKIGKLNSIKYKLIIRSKDKDYKGQNIRVFNGIISDEEYYGLYNSADLCLMLYKSKFKNRFASNFLNAFENKKYIVGTPTNMMKDFNKNYPINSCIFNGVEDLVKILESNIKTNESEFEKFKKDYSENVIVKQLKEIIL